MMEPCIAAIATPHASGGIAVIRLSGKDAFAVAGAVFTSASGKTAVKMNGYTAAYGSFHQPDGEKIDEGVLLVFRAPHSYTGEDVVELSCHGGIGVSRKLLKACFAAGAQPAQKGEFTKRAFLNGKMSLTQAEAVADLIAAESDSAVKSAEAAREGNLYREIRSVCGQLVQADGHLQAWIDYPEEDMEEVEKDTVLQTLEQQRRRLEQLLKNYDTGRMVREGIAAVLVGKPNVGKSTLMNLLTGADTSIVTEIAGTTRDVVAESISIEGVALRLFDTAGIHHTADPVEQIGVERARKAVRQAAVALVVFDSSRPLETEDWEIVREIQTLPKIAVVNKADIGRCDFEEYEKMFDSVVVTSSRQPETIEQLKAEIARLCKIHQFDSGSPMLANERQRQAAEKALEELKKAIRDLKSDVTWDAVGVLMDSAIDALLQLTGENASEAVVNEVFSHFCVGK